MRETRYRTFSYGCCRYPIVQGFDENNGEWSEYAVPAIPDQISSLAEEHTVLRYADDEALADQVVEALKRRRDAMRVVEEWPRETVVNLIRRLRE